MPVHRIFKMILFSTSNKRDNKKDEIKFKIIEPMELVDKYAFPFSPIPLRKLYIFNDFDSILNSMYFALEVLLLKKLLKSFQEIITKYALKRSFKFCILADRFFKGRFCFFPL